MYSNVLEYLEEAESSYPEKLAFGDEARELTYHTVAQMARQIGSRLSELGAVREPVVVLVDKDVMCIAAFLGIVYSGCFYVPVDKDLPIGRIQAIFSVVEPRFVISRQDEGQYAAELWPKAKTLSLESLLGDGGINAGRLNQVRERHLDTDPLYMIFTSGSTGVPKGVLVSHKSVIDMAEQFTKVFHFSQEEVFANQAPFDFDVSVKDIYLTLKNGASMQIVPKSMFVLPKKLVGFLNGKKVTTLIWAASALGVVAAFRAFGKESPQYLKKIMFSGEVLPIKVLHYWQQYQKDAMYVNLYGPTEITCNCTYYIVDREFQLGETLPIGKAFPNTEILLLDEKDGLAEPGASGEICVRGSSLALGYYKDKAASSKAFCQNPLQDGYRDLIYRTGDMGYLNERGELVFTSRKDYQIKHMGHRIELFEIEAAVDAIEGVEKCCCIYNSAREKIVLLYQAGEDMEVKIIEGLRQRLPKYMCPNLFHRMDKLPENSHGKIDRNKLKQEYIEK